MGRSKKACNKLFAQYEGLAVVATGRLWERWGQGLCDAGMDLDDLRQESFAILLDLCGRLDRRKGERRCRIWIIKSLRGRLLNLIKAKAYPKVREIPTDLIGFFDRKAELPATLPYFSLIFNQKTREFCERILAGDSEWEARRAVGWIKADQRKAMAKLRQKIERD